MNKIILIFLTGLFLLACNRLKRTDLQLIELKDNWKFQKTGDTVWLEASVPGCVHTDLLYNGLIKDPFYRMNEKGLQWIDKADWDYQTNFYVTEEMKIHKVLKLDFKGLDTYADVYLNDSLVLHADNMYREWEVDCKNLILVGENKLKIHFRSPITEGLKKLEAYGMALPAANDFSEIGEMGDKKVSVFSRKAPYHFGWDWGPRLVTSGIWRPVYIKMYDKAVIENLLITRDSLGKDKAKLTATFEINAVSDQKLDLIIKLANVIKAKTQIDAKAGIASYSLSFYIYNPELWWSNGMGKAHLYSLKGEVRSGSILCDTNFVNIGLRSLKLVQKPDSMGKSFYFEINGVPVFAKGANYIPNDVFLNRVKPENYEYIIKSAVEANMNMLRVWGGGIYENDIFYDLCDKYGIMIWHDFMFACSMYPGDSLPFLENVRQEVIQNIKRLRNHPCIALWVGNNEIYSGWYGWNWQEKYNGKQKEQIWKGYENIFHQLLPEIISKYDSVRPYWPSTPFQALDHPLKFPLHLDQKDYDDKGKWVNQSGDVHFWAVWHGKKPFEYFSEWVPRFVSEYGFQSFPDINTIRKFSEKDDWQITSPVMNWHQRSGPGNMLIKTYLDYYYKNPKDFESFLFVNQLLQAKGVVMAIEAHRRHMPECMGTLYWQLNDCWPAPSWSSIDYYGRWKALHYAVKKAYQNILISPVVEKEFFRVYVVSDELKPIQAEMILSIKDFSGKELWTNTQKIELSENTSKIYFQTPLEELLKGMDKRKIVCFAQLFVDNKSIADHYFYFTDIKNLELPKPKITLRTDKDMIVITTDLFAKDIYLQSDKADVSFSDNYFDLLPGQFKSVICHSSTKIVPGKDIKIITLTDSY